MPVKNWVTVVLQAGNDEAFAGMNLIHLNLMAGFSLDDQSKETPAMKNSGKMGNSRKFQILLRAK
jgi:hypothetical protein